MLLFIFFIFYFILFSYNNNNPTNNIKFYNRYIMYLAGELKYNSHQSSIFDFIFYFSFILFFPIIYIEEDSWCYCIVKFSHHLMFNRKNQNLKNNRSLLTDCEQIDWNENCLSQHHLIDFRDAIIKEKKI